MAQESGTKDIAKAAPTSPARSDKSSDSEGKPVREKLKQTSIDATGAVVDQTMNDTNGKTSDQSVSGSDTERGRLTRKRSREELDEDNDADKHSEKKHELGKGERHHTRKRSRDVKDIANGPPFKPVPSTVSRIEENDADELMTSPARKNTKGETQTTLGADTSPKNKRTRDQAETVETETANGAAANGKPVSTLEQERESKRLRDEEVVESNKGTAESKSKIQPGSGFANTSTASPFAAMSSKPQEPKTSKPDSQPQTSDDKFKASGFGNFASSEKSPFGGLGGSGAASPFGAASGSKLSSFASSSKPESKPEASTSSGFGALGSSNKSSFGGGSFGSSLGGGFGSLGSAKPGLTSFATPADLTIKGLKSKPSAFGTPADQDKSDASDDDGTSDDEGGEKDGNTEDERRSSQPLLSQQPQETGEEGENTIWTGRAKLYTMSGEGSSKAWKERGTGTFRLNVTTEEPKKARFVLRADGTHRLLLNAAITKQLKFGDSNGEKSKDGKLLFNSPTPTGELEMHLLKLKAERGVELWEEVDKLKETEL